MVQYLNELKTRFGIKPHEFVPISTWFSYGSNLSRHDFERKMLDKGSYLSLVRARPARLEGWERKLENESRNRGLAYSISKGGQASHVDGIVHDVPIADLPAFLRFEGVLNTNYHLMCDDKRRYDIERVDDAQLLRGKNETQSCFVLAGRCPISDKKKREEWAICYKDELIEYVRTSIKGAVGFGIDVAPFEADLKWIQNLR